MLDPDELAAFVAIATERSFSRAADRLGIVQSVVSKRLRRLEDRLETRLVDRSIRTDIRLTRVGALFLGEATRTLADLERAERIGRDLGRGTRGPLRIGFVFSAAMNGALTTILTQLRDQLPALQLEPRLMETPEQLAALADGQLDMALLRPRPSYPPECSARIIHSEPLVIALAEDHALARAPSLSIAMLAGERFIVPQFHEQVGLIDDIRTLARRAGFAMPQIIRTGDFVTAACLAATGDGIVLAPRSLSRMTLGGTCYRGLIDYEERLETVLAYRNGAPAQAVECVGRLFRRLIHS